MMRKLVLGLALALVPSVADAQIGVPRPVPQMDAPPSQGGGISVTGSAQQRLAVRELRFIAYAHGPSDERGVLDAMRGAGIVDASVGSPLGGFGSGNTAVLRGTIREVSKAKLDAIAMAAAAYVRAHPGASIDNAQFFASSADCAKMEDSARIAALGEARRRADAIAAATKLNVGSVIRVAENGGCLPWSDGPGGPQVDAASLTATLTVTEFVTYAIVQPDGSRRRPL
jgi:Protein of unknown function (DUF541)